MVSNRTRGNRHKLKQKKFHTKRRKNFIPMKVPEHWNRLCMEVMESSLEIFKIHPAAVYCTL